MAERKTIYLDDALEAIRKLPNAGIHWFVSAEAVFDALLNLPSAEIEHLTDEEQRIFLAAMEREEKVCKKVDEECRHALQHFDLVRDCREPYEDSLVRTCHEIIRKVKGALWT